ncbi:MAG: VOC family protein [Rhodospirillaceae bacterium]
MSIRFGEIRQIAFVVDDIDAVMAYWTDVLGVGPFFVKRRLRFDKYVYRGEPRKSSAISIALANSGGLQVELVEQHDDRPSIYKEFRDRQGQGFQHVSAWLTRADFDATRERLLAAGMALAQSGTIPSSGVRLAYFASEDGPGGFIYEIADLKEPDQYARVMNIAKAAAEWDGGQAVIEVDK